MSNRLRDRIGRLPPLPRSLPLLLVLGLGLLLFVWRLGSTGLVDETPPLFAAAARAMAETGDWLIPRVNGLPRYDKPPLVYWLMAAGYSLPGQAQWNPLGTWASGLPSALASVAVMLGLAHTLLRWPQPPLPRHPGATALGAALAYALSPLVLLWGRIAVSDALFSALVAFSLLLCWQTYADPAARWWRPWPVLGLAVLAKGPVAVLLLALTLALFAWLQADPAGLWRRLRPLRGLPITAAVALPWYGLALWVEGRPYWDSFFGYHNLQRFTSVVNQHLQPWWYFLPVLLLTSLPATPLLLLGLARAIGPLRRGPWPARPLPPAASLGRFAACWLLAVLLFFTLAATKLPSYWLPATPAAGLLIALAAQPTWAGQGRSGRLAWGATLLLTLLLAGVFLAAPVWLPWIQEPELPTLPAELRAAGWLTRAGLCFLLAAVLALVLRRLPALLLPIAAFVPLALLPSWALGDRLRGAPVRAMAAAVVRQGQPGEPVAMVGVLKPSLHYYSRRVVLYEGQEPVGLVNLADRLRRERRAGQRPSTAAERPSVLVVIDERTAALPHWRGLAAQELARSGLYRLWRLERSDLEQRAALLGRALPPDWDRPRPERY